MNTPVRLDQRLWFPDPAQAAPAGLVAVGGDLSTERLLLAYRSGIFPWSVNPVTWWSPDPRGIFELDQFHVSRSLARLLKQAPFEVTRDRAFRDVMLACATVPGREDTWISPEFIAAYGRLHEQGHAHSVECWQNGVLAGGVYGVTVGGVFAGESMFHHVPGASKIALHHLAGHLRSRQFQLFDIQMLTPATKQLGAVQIPRQSYLDRLRRAVDLTASFT
jgi:leucyl/phenylalanyl-tRNA--protein transferase